MALILVLDDERDACKLMTRLLSSLGHEIQAFTDHLQGLDWLKVNTPGLVLIDIKPQRANGLLVLESIRTQYPQHKIMMITCCPSPETLRRTEELGVEDCLVKPFEIDELERRLTEALQRKSKGEGL